MKISFTTMATPELSVPEQFAVARAYGFDSIDLRMMVRGGGEISENLTQEEADAIVKASQGIEIASLLCYNEKVESGKETMSASLRLHMELAKKLRIPMIRIFTGKLETAAAQEQLVEILKDVLQSDQTGTKIAMQNHLNSSVTLHQALEVCKAVGHPRLSIIASPDHSVLIAEEYLSLLPELAPYTSQLYVADMNENRKAVLPGQGIMPFDQILRSLRDNGFDGSVSFKWERCWHPEIQPYETAFAAFVPWIRELCGN